MPFRIRFDFNGERHFRPFVNYLYLGWLASLAVFVNRRVDVWFVESYRGISELGQYAVAVGYVSIGGIIMVALSQVLMPHLAAMQTNEQRTSFAFFSRINLLLAVVLAIVAFIAATWVIPFVYGPDFAPSALPACILCLGLVFSSIRNLCSAYNYALHRLRHNLVGDFAALIITVLFNFLLVPILGMKGAAITSVIAYGISAAVLAAGVFSHARLGISEAFLPKKSDVTQFFEQVKGVRLTGKIHELSLLANTSELQRFLNFQSLENVQALERLNQVNGLPERDRKCILYALDGPSFFWAGYTFPQLELK